MHSLAQRFRLRIHEDGAIQESAMEKIAASPHLPFR
jgi:hypothetical protein